MDKEAMSRIAAKIEVENREETIRLMGKCVNFDKSILMGRLFDSDRRLSVVDHASSHPHDGVNIERCKTHRTITKD